MEAIWRRMSPRTMAENLSTVKGRVQVDWQADGTAEIRPGPGIPPGYIVPIAKRSPPHQHRASSHAEST